MNQSTNDSTHSLPQESILKRKFSIREIGGAFGDWGTLIPFIIGYISIIGLNPSGIFLTLGLTNIILGIRFNLPLPVQPQKTIGSVAIAERWNSTQVISTGLFTGVLWLGLGFTRILNKIAQWVPEITVRAIQLGLALILSYNAFEMIQTNWWLSFGSLLIIILFLKVKSVSSALILTFLGIGLMFYQQTLQLQHFSFGFPQFTLSLPSLTAMWFGIIHAGIAQLFLTLTNVMVATVKLAHDLFPEKKESFDANTLAINMGLMNIANPFLGGMPLCHGSGGLAAQYAFGARTGGSMIVEGLIEIIFGLFFSQSLLIIFQNFPQAIFGSMLVYTAILLGKVAITATPKKLWWLIGVAGVFCVIWNITIGFGVAVALWFIVKKFQSRKQNSVNHQAKINNLKK